MLNLTSRLSAISILLGIISLVSIDSASGQTPINLSPSVNPANLTLTGKVGGTVDSQGCGYISNSPSQVIIVTERIDYLKLEVETTGGEPTLLIDGPDGRFCSMNDSTSNQTPEISGVWLPGKYLIYIGDRQKSSNSQYNYTLNFSGRS